MSASVDEISKVVNRMDGDDEEDEEEDAAAMEKLLQRRRRGFGKAKEVVLHPFTKAKNKIRRIRSRRALLRSSPSSSSGNASGRGGSSSGKGIVRGDCNRTENGTGNGNGSGCGFCFSRPRVLESGDDSSPTSDPNNPNFTHAMLRSLIEKNDFCCKECNPHVD